MQEHGSTMNRDPQPSGANEGNLRTLVLVFLAILLSEVTLRSTENLLSDNIAHINEIPELVAEYDPKSEPSFVFIGNSLTNNGVDLRILDEWFLQNSTQIGDSTKLVPDATTIWSWSCVVENQFFDSGITPGHIVLGFAWNQLSDQSRILPTRLGAFFCSASDLFEINRHKALSSAEIGEFFTAMSLRTYAHRDTVRNRTLSAVVPYYEPMTQQINRQQRDVQNDSEVRLSYSVLDSLISSLESHGSSLVVVAMPVRDNTYIVDQALKELLGRRGIPLFDYTNMKGLDDSSFLDDMHLNTEGAAALSTRLAEDLSTVLANPVGQRGDY